MRNRVYIASKAKHAPKWQALIAAGYNGIQCEWFNYAGTTETDDSQIDYGQLWDHCITDVQEADALVLYCEPGEVLKGAILELGVALARDKRVILVGSDEDLRRNGSWLHVRGIERAATVIDALNMIG
jgi:hypothetical protein